MSGGFFSKFNYLLGTVDLGITFVLSDTNEANVVELTFQLYNICFDLEAVQSDPFNHTQDEAKSSVTSQQFGESSTYSVGRTSTFSG